MFQDRTEGRARRETNATLTIRKYPSELDTIFSKGHYTMSYLNDSSTVDTLRLERLIRFGRRQTADGAISLHRKG